MVRCMVTVSFADKKTVIDARKIRDCLRRDLLLLVHGNAIGRCIHRYLATTS